jgi:hypothetical protein
MQIEHIHAHASLKHFNEDTAGLAKVRIQVVASLVLQSKGILANRQVKGLRPAICGVIGSWAVTEW